MSVSGGRTDRLALGRFRRNFALGHAVQTVRRTPYTVEIRMGAVMACRLSQRFRWREMLARQLVTLLEATTHRFKVTGVPALLSIAVFALIIGVGDLIGRSVGHRRKGGDR